MVCFSSVVGCWSYVGIHWVHKTPEGLWGFENATKAHNKSGEMSVLGELLKTVAHSGKPAGGDVQLVWLISTNRRPRAG